MKQKVICGILMPVLIVGSVAGCGASLAETENENTVGVEAPKAVESVSAKYKYQGPVQTPGILVNQVGYSVESEKLAVFCGKELPVSYSIISEDTGETVFTGDVLKTVKDEESGLYYGFAKFSNLKEGSYYIKADILGESYAFSVKEDAYSDVFRDACRKYYINRCGIAISESFAGDYGHSACHTIGAKLQENPEVQIDVAGGWHMDEQADRDSLIGSRIVENLVLAYEMDTEAFGDETGIPESGNGTADILDEVRYEVDWLLKMQDERTGGIYGAALTAGAANTDTFAASVVVTPVSMDATINFAAAMAGFSYIYQQIDAEYATTALRAADRAWSCFFINQNAVDNSAAFKAAASLYRATGDDKYNEVLKKYFSMSDFKDRFETDENIFLGSVAYLSTSQNVDKNQCEKLIKLLMKRSEDIAQKANESHFFVSGGSNEDNFATLLDDMRCLAVTNHIIYNYEYRTIIEDHAHFIMGMNPEAVNYVTESTERTYLDAQYQKGIMNDPQKDALLIFLLSALG